MHIMNYSVEENGKQQYRVLGDGRPLGTLKVLIPIGGVDAVLWTSAVYDVTGYAPSPDVAIGRIIIAATGHHELAEVSPFDYYLRPHNAGESSDAKHVAYQIARLLDMLSFFGSSFTVNGGNGTLQQDCIRFKDKIIRLLKKESWGITIPQNEYRVHIPANIDPHDWTLRSVEPVVAKPKPEPLLRMISDSAYEAQVRYPYGRWFIWCHALLQQDTTLPAFWRLKIVAGWEGELPTPNDPGLLASYQERFEGDVRGWLTAAGWVASDDTGYIWAKDV